MPECSRCNWMDTQSERMGTERFRIAMAYVPWQQFEGIYDDLDRAFRMGTIFPELNKPFTGRRCM